MQVFKVYFKVIQKNLFTMFIYLGIFLFLSVALSNLGGGNVNTDFTQTKTRIAFINNDGDSKLVDGFKNYLAKNTNIINIPDNREKLQDALFFRKIEYIVRIPAGYSKDFLDRKNVQIEKTTVPSSVSSMYMDFLINKYFNTAKLYLNNIPGFSEAQLVEEVSKNIDLNTKVEVNNFGSKSSENDVITYYFSYFAYSMFAIVILGVTSFMMVFNDVDIKKRNLSSPIKTSSINMQMILGNLTFVLGVWAALIFFGILIYGSEMLSANRLLMWLNSLILSFVFLSISFLIGSFIKSKGAQAAAANVLSLGLCFISGVFVPQFLLGKTVLTIASFTPTYWYVKANNALASLVNYSPDNLLPIVYSMLVQLGFAIAILAVALVIVKQKRVSNGA